MSPFFFIDLRTRGEGKSNVFWLVYFITIGLKVKWNRSAVIYFSTPLFMALTIMANMIQHSNIMERFVIGVKDNEIQRTRDQVSVNIRSLL